MIFKEVVKRIYRISRRELRIMYNNPIYGFCTIIFPLFAVFFFTSLMNEGNPIELPIGVVEHVRLFKSLMLSKARVLSRIILI